MAQNSLVRLTSQATCLLLSDSLLIWELSLVSDGAFKYNEAGFLQYPANINMKQLHSPVTISHAESQVLNIAVIQVMSGVVLADVDETRKAVSFV